MKKNKTIIVAIILCIIIIILSYIFFKTISKVIPSEYLNTKTVFRSIFDFVYKNIDNLISRLFVLFFLLFFIFLIFKPFILMSIKTSREVEDYYNEAKKAIKIENDLKTKNDNINNSDIRESKDIIELMLLNMKEIKEYYVLSKTMAKSSFHLSVIMCILGFIIILTSIISLFVVNISLTQLIVPVIGGSVVEVIAGTSLIVYKKSLEQLNQYYEALHNNEKYLSLVSLAGKLSNEKKDETYINIINSQLEKLK